MPQLHSLGMLQTCEVLKVGMPTRVSYADVAALFRSRLPPAALAGFAQRGDRMLVQALLWALEVPADSFRLGITRLFFRTGKISELEKLLKADLESDRRASAELQSRLRRWLARRLWRQSLAAVQSHRAALWLLALVRSRESSALLLQSQWRGARARARVGLVRARAGVAAAARARARRRLRRALLYARACARFGAALRRLRQGEIERVEQALRAAEALVAEREREAAVREAALLAEAGQRENALLRKLSVMEREAVAYREEAAAMQVSQKEAEAGAEAGAESAAAAAVAAAEAAAAAAAAAEEEQEEEQEEEAAAAVAAVGAAAEAAAAASADTAACAAVEPATAAAAAAAEKGESGAAFLAKLEDERQRTADLQGQLDELRRVQVR
jgi:myosin heavy subunit